MLPATRLLQYLALVYAGVAWIASIVGAWVATESARHFVLGLLVGPWAEQLDLASTTGARWLSAILLLSWAVAAGLFLAMHFLKKSSNRHAYGVTGLLLAVVGGLVAGLEIKNAVVGSSFSGFIVFAFAAMAGGIWLAGEGPLMSSTTLNGAPTSAARVEEE